MWYRIRFQSTSDDYRPVKFPPPGPYWCSGQGNGYFCLVGYFKSPSEVKSFWPEAEVEFVQERKQITFTDRFPRPEWWADDGNSGAET